MTLKIRYNPWDKHGEKYSPVTCDEYGDEKKHTYAQGVRPTPVVWDDEYYGHAYINGKKVIVHKHNKTDNPGESDVSVVSIED